MGVFCMRINKFIFTILLGAFSSFSIAGTRTITYQINKTKVIGIEKSISQNNKIHIFRGIPYAESPTGKRRWTVTNLRDLPISGTLDASKFGNICPYQILPRLKEDYGEAETLVREEAMSENCLFLNIWKPAKVVSGKKLPILFVIHGGGFVRNSTRESKIDGAALASKGVIVVSAEYRIGPLGFFNHSSFDKNSFWGNTNFGLIDQVQALRWVKRNMKRFSGDTSNVTIVGGSAGGASVYYHLSSNISKYYYKMKSPLFHKAISIGGGGFGNLLPREALAGEKNQQSANTIAATFLENLRIDPIARCSNTATEKLRNRKYSVLLKSAIPVSEIVRQCPTVKQLTDYFGFKLSQDQNTILTSENRRYPYIDNTTVLGSGSIPILQENPNSFLPVPLLNGAAKNEAEVLKYLQKDPLSRINWMKSTAMKELDERRFVYKIASMYGVDNKSYINRNYNYLKQHFAEQFYGDGTFNQPANLIAKIHSRNANTYSYIYAYQPTAHTRWRKWQYSKKLEGIDDIYKLSHAMNDAGHTNEFFAFFGNFDARLKNVNDVSDIDRDFSNKTQQYLINFMTSGNPNSGPYTKLVPWARNRNGKTVQHLGVSWRPDHADDYNKKTQYNISTMYNHKSQVFDYFEELFRNK
jgi:carboxylesterase type B